MSTETKKTSLERLEELEVLVNSMAASMRSQNINALRDVVNKLSMNLNNMSKATDALISALSNKNVLQLSDIKEEAQRMDVENKMKVEDGLIAKGFYVEVETVSSNSLVSIQERIKDSNEIVNVRELVPLESLEEKVKNLFVGKKKGDIAEEGDRAYEVMRVLDAVQQASSSEEAVQESSQETAKQ